jgi:phage shock protein E
MNTLKELVNDSATLEVDVRSQWEFEEAHIPGAKNIPLDEVPLRIQELKSANTPVVLYCRSGNRSGMAVSILKQNGIANVYNGGGIANMQVLLN